MPYEKIIWVEDTDPIYGTGWCGWIHADTGETVEPQPPEPKAEYPF